MGQMNIGNLFVEIGCGVNTNGKSQQISNTTSGQFFKNTLNGANTSFEKSSKSSEMLNNSSKDPFKPKLKEYSKSNDIEATRDQKVKQQELNSKIKEESLSVKEDLQLEKEEESKEHTDENQILMLMSEGLNLSIEEIQRKLEELGLDIKDLKTKEGFGTFISEVYGQGSIAELLMNLEDVKSMTALFEQLNNLHEETFTSKNVQDIVQQTQMGLQQQEEVMSNTTQKEFNGDHMIFTKELDEEANGHMEAIQPYEGKGETSSQNLNLFQQQNEDIGFTVSTNHFSTNFIQKFETDLGLMTQTTTKAMLSETVVMEQIDFKMLGQTKEINLQLSPKELGDLNIKIVENNSVLVAEIKVDNDKAKDLILSELHRLKESLESQGLTITDVKVDIRQSNQKSQMEQERQKSSKRIQEIISKQLTGIEEEEIISMQMTSEIDYMV